MTAQRKFLTLVGSFALLLAFLGGVNVTLGQEGAVGSVMPVVGIGAGQALRVGIAALPPDPVRPNAQRCQATLSFLDARTRLPVGTVKRFDLGPGEADFHDVDSRALGLRPGRRSDLQPVLAQSADSGSCQVAYTGLGVLRGSQYSYPVAEYNRGDTGALSDEIQATPLLPSLGFGQTMLHTVVRKTQPFDINNDPLPCNITLFIRRHPGSSLVASLVTGALAPSQIKTLSVSSNSLGLSFGETAFLTQEVLSSKAQIILPGGQTLVVDSGAGCITSVQVFDNLTGWTTVLLLHLP